MQFYIYYVICSLLLTRKKNNKDKYNYYILNQRILCKVKLIQLND